MDNEYEIDDGKLYFAHRCTVHTVYLIGGGIRRRIEPEEEVARVDGVGWCIYVLECFESVY
jgi:hypothetical protein